MPRSARAREASVRALALCLPAARTRAAGGAVARFGVRPALDRREAMQQLDRIDGLVR